MSDPSKITLEELISSLKQHRDELELKVNLATAEGKEEWRRATEKMDEMLRDYEPLKKAIGESASEVATSLKLVGEEIMESFKRIRKTF